MDDSRLFGPEDPKKVLNNIFVNLVSIKKYDGTLNLSYLSILKYV